MPHVRITYALRTHDVHVMHTLYERYIRILYYITPTSFKDNAVGMSDTEIEGRFVSSNFDSEFLNGC
jgi:hypothetical protein